MNGTVSVEGFIRSIQKTDIGLLLKNPLIRGDGDVEHRIGFYSAHEFQHDAAIQCGGLILNAACGDDAAGLGDIGAVNFDFQDVEGHTGIEFRSNKNFVQGSVFEMPFDDESFDTVVLGEFLEHCTQERAVEALTECRRVLRSGGRAVITIPLDGRPAQEQRCLDPADYREVEYFPGVTHHHQTWWSNQMIRELRKRTRFTEVVRCLLVYILTAPLGGWGLVWEKP